ncbi:AI-2E family transporter [Phycisphaerales bacterium AB-hyl4]|uniref:AI-2E family transporter n=1 Tax=Natronomicrosphaera hydrolytica TaxID=3242702 RepID=A0ABV4U7G7_9BACT
MESLTNQSDPSSQRLPLWVTLLIWGSLVGLVFFFWEAFSLVFMLLLAAAAVAGLLRPVSRRVSHNPMHGGLIVGLGFWVVFASLIALLGWLLYDPIAQQFQQWPETEQSINRVLREWLQWLGIDVEVTLRELLLGVVAWLGGEGGPDMDILAELADGIGVLVVALVVLVFGSTFLLIEPPGLITGPIARILPDAYGKAVRATFGDIDFRLRWWLIGIMISMSAVGTLAGFGFWLAGLEFWLPLAIFAGLAEIVPILGPSVAFLIALLFAATQGPNEMIGVLIVWAVVQVLEPYVLVPIVMRKAVRIPPVVTLFTVVLWARIFGPLGLLLAIPINITIWAFISNFVLKRREQARQQYGRSPPPPSTPPPQTSD